MVFTQGPSAHPRFLLKPRSLGTILDDSTSFGSAGGGCRKNLPFCGRGILTAQESEIFINDSGLELRWLKPYFVRRDDNSSAYPVSPDVPGGTGRCSSNWNGYIATMRLHADHRLELVQFDFPYHENTPTQICNAFFTGDFSITFRPFFHGPNTTIPFRDGRVIPDQDEWEIDDQLLDGVVSLSLIHI